MKLRLAGAAFCLVLSFVVPARAEAQNVSKAVRDQLGKYAKGIRFEVLGPDHPLTQDVPFVITVVADAPAPVIDALEERSPDGVAQEGFSELDVWNDAIHFHESKRHLGSDAASCRISDSSGRSTSGVRQIGPIRFGLYASPLRTSVAWQATMVLTRSGKYTIETIPAFTGNSKPIPLEVAVEPHWPASLRRALLLSMLVIGAAVLLVAPPRILPLVLVTGIDAVLAWQAVPTTGELHDVYFRYGAAAIPIVCAFIARLSGKPLLNLLLPERQSGALTPASPLTPAPSLTPAPALTPVPSLAPAPPMPLPEQKVAQPQTVAQEKPDSDVAGATQTEPPAGAQPAEGDGGGETKTAAWKQKLAAAWQTGSRNVQAFAVWLRGPVKAEHVLAKEAADLAAVQDVQAQPAAAPVGESGSERRSLPEAGALRRYKEVADGIVAAAEHRAQWQLVIGGACGLAAVVFLLRVSVTFGDAAMATPRAGETIMPLLVRVLPYLLCFGSLLLAAGFLLRQYRASLDDFRHFIRNQRLRESQVVAFEAARFIRSDDDVARKTIEILAWGEAAGARERESSSRDAGERAAESTAGG